MRTRFQALLGSTALASAIAVAAVMSSGSARLANADVVTDTVRKQLTALMNAQSAAIPEATRTAVGAALSSTSDGAQLMAQLNGLAVQNAALAETIGMALGKASLSLELSNVAAAGQLNGYVSSASNPNIVAGYNSAKTPITAQTLSQLSGRQVAQSPEELLLLQQQILDGVAGSTFVEGVTGLAPVVGGSGIEGLSGIQPSAGLNSLPGPIGNSFSNILISGVVRQISLSVNYIVQSFKIGPYSA
ncbi:MAG: hypothetical protein ACK4NA_05915 [Alphaproteobacteria bacterium]